MHSLILRITFIFVVLLFGIDTVLAQSGSGRGGTPTAGRGGTPAPRPTAGPAAPTGGKANGGSPGNTDSGPKAITTTDLDEARLRKRRKEERDKQQDPSSLTAPAAATPVNLVFQPLTDKDVRVMSTSFDTVAMRGQHPFTVVKVQVANLSDAYISIQEIRLNGRRVTALDLNDPRTVPMFPLGLNRFSDKTRLNSPIPPRQRQTYSFAFPFAMKSPTDLDARILRYVKFITLDRVDWSPLQIVDWSSPETETDGRKHQGMIITLQNKAAYPVNGRLKVLLDGVEHAGGRTLFFDTVSLEKYERKTLVLRTIPDEGLRASDPKRKTMPEKFKVRNVEIADLQF